jgi:membrane protease YdiL (CAAX protease family)
VVALFAVWFNHVKGISTDLDSRKDRSFIKMIVVAVFSVCIGTILFDSFVGFLLNGILPITEDVALDKTAFDYIVAILIAPVTEEYYYRKGMYGYIREKINIPIAMILTTLIFSMHGYNLQGTLSVFFGGILYALIYEYSGNIMYSICAHMMHNAFVNIVNALDRHGVHLLYNLNGYDIYTLPVLLTAILLVTIILTKGKLEIGKRKIQSTCS